ncbi:MAG: beta-ketoacyl-ACP synthase II [Anaeroplasmataceae bacterium]
MNRVVITGLGMVSPIGNNVCESWEGIKNKKCGIDKITLFNTDEYKVKLAGEVKNLNFEDFLTFKEIKNNDRFAIFAKIAAKEAMADSALDLDSIDHDRFGVCVASGIGGLKTIEDTAITLQERGNTRVSPYFIPKTLINLAAGSIAIEYKANGYVSSVVTACAAGTNAIGDAYNRIKFGFEDIMLAGGSEASICELGISGFQSMKALCTSDNPSRASIPFDNERSGFVMGEGAGILVLESLDHALKRNAKIYGEVVGYGVSCDAHHITAPCEDGGIAAKAMVKALKDANITPEKIDYINAHGTSTHLNDLTETNAIKLVFGEHAYDLAVSSTKSNTGHLLGAAGAIEAIFSTLALKDGIIPPTINYKEADPECDLDIVANEVREKNITYAMSNSLGFGGHNACIIIKRWDD